MQALRALADNAQLGKKHSNEILLLVFSKAYLPSHSCNAQRLSALTTNENLSKAI